MNFAAIIHETKSRYAYAYDNTTLHLRIKVAKKDVVSARVIAVDPFNWFPNEKGEYYFDKSTVFDVEMIYEGETQYHDVWFVEIKNVHTKRIRYTFMLEAANGKTYAYGVQCLDATNNIEKFDGIYNSLNFPFLNDEDIYQAPSWVKNAVWCQVTVSAYSKDGEQCSSNTEGTFKGMIKKLDYLQEMGFNALYLTPVFEGASWHNYDTTNYFKISPNMGTNEDFKAFIDEAHQRGIKVMLDAVFNHCGPLHPFWQDVLRHGKESKYYDCFYINNHEKPNVDNFDIETGLYDDKVSKDLNYRSFGYTTFMPKIKTSHPLWRDQLLEVGRYWVEEYNIDGWRLDVSNEVTHDFWREFRKVIKSANKDVYIMGENWDDSYPWLRGDQFDSVMNYTFMNAVWGLLNHKLNHKIPLTPTGYQQAITTLSTMYPKGVNEHMFNLVSSHDVDRILDAMSHDKRKVLLSFVLLMSYSGSPCVHYGDEIGMSGKELSNRSPMLWDTNDQDTTIQTHVKKLISLRKSNSALSSMDIDWEMTDDSNNLLIYTKKSDKNITILLNLAEECQTIILPKHLQNRIVTDIYNDCTLSFSTEVKIEAHQFLIVK